MYLSWGQIRSHYDVTYEKYTKEMFPYSYRAIIKDTQLCQYLYYCCSIMLNRHLVKSRVHNLYYELLVKSCQNLKWQNLIHTTSI